jgi:hypothetical protein
MPQNLTYAERTAIKNNQIIYSNYVQRQKLVTEGRLLGLNVFPPNHDASAVTATKSAFGL